MLADRLRDPRHLSEDGRAWLAPYRTARRRFHQEYRALAAALLVGRADVRECFPSISGRAVERALLRLGCHPSHVVPVRRLLDRFIERGIPGLPVGPPASAVLAKAVLAEADRALGGHLR